MRRDLVIILTAAALLIAWLGWQARPDDSARTLLQATRLLGEAPENFTQVTEPRPFVFPADHAAHPGYRNEWWYFTGNLQGADERGNSREFGFQFTLFRFELDPGALPDSAWAASAVWMAHLALSDIDIRNSTKPSALRAILWGWPAPPARAGGWATGRCCRTATILCCP